jgi:hypothetical protein
MQGGFLIRHSRLTALGMTLCLLAALFAVEAKIAWFSPAGSAGAQISSAKARPAEPPKALPQHFASLAPPAGSFIAITTLLAVVRIMTPNAAAGVRVARIRPVVFRPDIFPAALFFRPPPSL